MKKLVIVYPSNIIDIRLYKFIKILKDNYNVYVLSYGMLKKSNIFEDLTENDFINIDIGTFFPANLPFNLLRDKKIFQQIEKIKPEIVLVRDIFISTFKKKKNVNRKYYLDFCDHFPEVLEVLYGFKGKIFKILGEVVEKRAIKNFDKRIFVSNEAMKFLEKKYKINIEGTIIENVPFIEEKVEKNFVKEIDLIYVGTINKKIRNLEIIFKAIEKIKNENKKITMSIYYFKHQSKIKEEYEKIANSLGIKEQIIFKEAVSKELLSEILVKHKVGLVPHCRNNATDYTIPNKIYDYMQIGLPILCSDNPSLENLLNKYRVGQTYFGNSVEDCSEKIIKILKDNLEEYSLNGIRIIKKELNWNKRVAASKLFDIKINE